MVPRFSPGRVDLGGAALLDRLVRLSTGVALILALIGVRLVLSWAHGLSDGVPETSTNVSLSFIVVVLTVTTLASLWKVRRDPSARAYAGSLTGHPPTGEHTSEAE